MDLRSRGSINCYLFIILISALLQVVTSQMNDCPTLMDAPSDPDTSCSFNNCSSLICQFPPAAEVMGSLTFAVENCVDPVRVNVMGTIQQGGPFQTTFVKNGVIHLGVGTTLSLLMSRNATHLNLQMTQGGTTVVPPLLVPLNPSDCMCRSLTSLAENAGHTFLVPVCNTNENCNGIRCTLDIFGNIYYIENVVLPCENATELVVEDRDLNPLHTSVYNETGRKPIIIGSTVIQVDAVIEPRGYSMDVAATIEEPLFGKVEIFPLHTIILDRTQCDLPTFTTIASPPPPTPLPQPISNSSKICLGFYEAIRQNYTKPFACEFLESCDSGVRCILSILTTSYKITISYTQGKFQFNVLMDGLSLINSTSLEVNVTLPSPMGSYLSFSQKTVTSTARSMKLDLYVLALNGLPRKDVLIPYSEILVEDEESMSQTAVAIAIVIPILAILAIALIITLVFLGICTYVRHQSQEKPFGFVNMSRSDLEESDLEDYLSASQSSLPSTDTGKQDMHNGNAKLDFQEVELKGGDKGGDKGVDL